MDEEIQLDTGKKLLLKTRVRNGKVSFEDNDVKYKYRNNCIPECIIDDLQMRKADGDLYITLHDSDKFEAIIKESGKIKQAANAAVNAAANAVANAANAANAAANAANAANAAANAPAKAIKQTNKGKSTKSKKKSI